MLCEFGFSVGNAAAQRRRQHAVTVGKERREALMRTKRLCRVGVSGDSDDVSIDDSDMMIVEDQSILEARTSSAVEELKLDVAYQYGELFLFCYEEILAVDSGFLFHFVFYLKFQLCWLVVVASVYLRCLSCLLVILGLPYPLLMPFNPHWLFTESLFI